MNALVFGAGKSGAAAAELLRRVGGRAAARPSREEGVVVRVLDGDDVYPDGAWDLAVTSPGVPIDHPWQVAARAAGVPVISELELGARHFAGKMLAVTGSKGKSSVVKLVADGLNAAGVTAVACGNYGTPLCDVALTEPQPEWAVVEVSSFQLETTNLPPGTFEAAAILNLQEDHLDRHGSVEVYHALKRRLLSMARPEHASDMTIFEGHRILESVCKDGPDELYDGSYFDNPVLSRNALAAIDLLSAAGVDEKTIRRAFLDFKPLPHRMQTVAEMNGVRYIDDSKATSIAALAAGVRMVPMPGLFRPARNVRLIAGGLAKGDNPKIAVPVLTTRVKKVYLIGRCADQFFDAWRETVPCEICGTLGRAVEMSRRDACAGEVVLLSPGTASFDQFNSYGARGDAFASFVRAEERGGGAESKK